MSFFASALLHTGAAALIIGAAALGSDQMEIPVVAVAPPTPIALEIDAPRPDPLLPEFIKPSIRPIAPPEAPLDFQPDRAPPLLPKREPPEIPSKTKTPPPDRPLTTLQRLPAPPSTAISAPSEIFNPPPEYPSSARRRGLEGMVILEITILADGTCAGAEVVEHEGITAFTHAALEAVQAWKYHPALRGGRPVSTTQRVRFVFRLKA